MICVEGISSKILGEEVILENATYRETLSSRKGDFISDHRCPRSDGRNRLEHTSAASAPSGLRCPFLCTNFFNDLIMST